MRNGINFSFVNGVRLNMLRLFLILMHVSMVSQAQQNIEKYVRSTTSEIHTLTLDSVDYSDLLPIANAIGDARFVFLGEQDHGDAPTYLAKTKLIKYLHEKKGFNVLAFECDFFSLNDGWDAIPHDKDTIRSFISRNLFGVWSSCDACEDLLYKYIPESFDTEKPLNVSGFDCQLFMTYSLKNLVPKLDSVLKKYKIQIVTAPNYATEIYPLINLFNSSINPSLDTATLRKRGLTLENIKQQLSKMTSSEDHWILIIDNMIQQNNQFLYANDYWKNRNLRDIQMAKNLEWLAEHKFRDKKIIVWAANYHISKYNGHYEEGFLNEAVTMGTQFTLDSLRNKQSYILGFTSLNGNAGRLGFKTYKLPRPKSNSFENWIPPHYNYAFTNFKPYNSNNLNADEDFFMSGSIKGNALHTYNKAAWNRIFDGIFFIRDMYPCNKRVKP